MSGLFASSQDASLRGERARARFSPSFAGKFFEPSREGRLHMMFVFELFEPPSSPIPRAPNVYVFCPSTPVSPFFRASRGRVASSIPRRRFPVVDSPSSISVGSIPRRRFDACDSRLTRARAPVCSPRRDTSHRLFRWPTRRSRPVRGVSAPRPDDVSVHSRARTSPRRF